MNELVSAGDWVDYEGEKYFLAKVGDNKEHIIVKEGALKVVEVKDLKKWVDKKEVEEN